MVHRVKALAAKPDDWKPHSGRRELTLKLSSDLHMDTGACFFFFKMDIPVPNVLCIF